MFQIRHADASCDLPFPPNLQTDYVLQSHRKPTDKHHDSKHLMSPLRSSFYSCRVPPECDTQQPQISSRLIYVVASIPSMPGSGSSRLLPVFAPFSPRFFALIIHLIISGSFTIQTSVLTSALIPACLWAMIHIDTYI